MDEDDDYLFYDYDDEEDLVDIGLCGFCGSYLEFDGYCPTCDLDGEYYDDDEMP